jgi:nickel-dependent lactate racemase
VCIVVGQCSNLQLSLTATRCLVEHLTSLGVASSSITVLRTADAPELDPTIVGVPAIVSHDPLTSGVVALEQSKYSFPVSLNSIFASADLRIAQGELKPHHMLGYSGLCDVVFPGLASRDSEQSHLTNRKNFMVTDLQAERVGIASSFKNLFALGFALNADLSPAQVAVATFQDCLEDLEKGVQIVCKRRIGRAADIVIMSAGGKPLDESLAHAVETLPAALPALKRDGVLIVAAECSSGYGNAEFYEWCAEGKEPRYLEMRLRRNFSYEGYKATFLLRLLEKHRVYFVSTIPDHYVENTFHMRPAGTVNAALQSAQRSLGSNSTVSVIPNAGRTILVQSVERTT